MTLAGPNRRSAAVPMSVRILIVEDYEPFRRFVCSALGKRAELQVIGEVSDGPAAVEKAKELKPDLILLDIRLPTLDGIEVARRIHELVPESKIIFLSMEYPIDVVQKALSLGALGYVEKLSSAAEILAAVEAVCQGNPYVSLSHLPVRGDLSWAAPPSVPARSSRLAVSSIALVDLATEILSAIARLRQLNLVHRDTYHLTLKEPEDIKRLSLGSLQAFRPIRQAAADKAVIASCLRFSNSSRTRKQSFNLSFLSTISAFIESAASPYASLSFSKVSADI